MNIEKVKIENIKTNLENPRFINSLKFGYNKSNKKTS